MALTIAAGAMLPSFADRTLNDGLVAYLPFDNSMTENAVAGSPVAPEASTATVPTFVDNGMVGKCLNIPSGAYVKLTGSDSVTLANSSLGFEDSNRSFTAIVWANHGALANDPVIFANKNWGGPAKGALLCAKTVSNKPTVQFNAGNNSSRIDSNATAMQFTGEGTGKWTFYAMVCSNGTFHCYQGRSDGTFSSKNPATLSNFDMDTGYPFVLGQQGDCAYGRLFSGQLDDFALWNRALSPADIRRIYEFGRSGAGLGDVLKIDANDAPTMEVAKSGDDQYTLTFGGRRNGTHALYIAAATDDKGEDKYAWDTFVKIDDIPVATNTYTYTVPMSYFQANQRFRFFLMQTENLPYAREVEYAHSDGSAWINSGIAPRRDMTAEFDVYLTAKNTTGNYDWMFGSFGTAKSSNYGLNHFYNRSKSDANSNKWDQELTGGGVFKGESLLQTAYHIAFGVASYTVNGTEYTTGATVAEFVETGYPINLFRNEKNGNQYDQTMIGYFKTFSLYTPEYKVRDYVPAEDSEGDVGLFDRVTGQFQSSAGTALTAGADKDSTRYGWVHCVSEPYLASSTTPATAFYIGGGTDPLDLTDGANWACTNVFGFALPPDAVPTADTDITVAGTTAFAVPQGTTLACKSIKFENVTFADGADLRGLDISKATADSSIDLQGRSLLLSGLDGTSAAAFTITDTSSGVLGTLCWEVSGTAVFESATVLTGNLRLVKSGTGVYSAAMASQTYTGSTDVSNGTVRVGSSGTGHFGTGTVTVPSNTVFDVNGMDASSVTMVLAGGTLQNSAASKATLPKTLTLTADSQIVHANASSSNNDMQVPNQCNWNLGGKTLSISMTGNDSDFNFLQDGPNVVSNGTISVTVGTAAGSTKGYFAIRQINKQVNGGNGLNLDLGNTYLRLQNGSGNSSVMDFTANPVGDVYSFSPNRLQIYGTFTPKTVTGFDMTMMDGSTLNLSNWSDAFNCAFKNPKYKNQPVSYDLRFAANSTVTVNLAGRTDLKTIAKSESPYVVTWSTKPADTTTFVLDAVTRQHFKCEVTDAGLRLKKINGLVIIVQ